jgi:hypothetical protein
MMIKGSFPVVGKVNHENFEFLETDENGPKENGIKLYFISELMTRTIVANSVCRNLLSLLSLQGRKIAFNIILIFM